MKPKGGVILPPPGVQRLRQIRFDRYTDFSRLPAPPRRVNYTGGLTAWGAMLNFKLDICAVASAGHMIQAWTHLASRKRVTVGSKPLVDMYSGVSGYNPKTGKPDEGCDVETAFRWWRDKGLGGHKIEAWCWVDPHQRLQVETAHWLFGGLYVVLNLPATALDQWDKGVPWSGSPKPNRPGTQPGSGFPHAVNVVAIGPNYLTAVTWGTLQPITPVFWDSYVLDCYPVLSQDWISPNLTAPSGFDLEALKADLGEMA